MKLVSRNEEVVMLTILKLQDNAYGVSIRERIFEDTGHLWSFASIYQPLDKLVRKGLVNRTKGVPTAERGGKSKFFYTLTSEGKRALVELRKAHEQVWAGIPEIVAD